LIFVKIGRIHRGVRYRPDGFTLLSSELREDSLTALRTIGNRLRQQVDESAALGLSVKV
jgi:hypothetical protein